MPGWTLLNLFCKMWFDSFYAVQLIQALIVNICVFYIVKKYTTHIFLCVLLYGITGQFFNFNTEVMREAIAIGLSSIGIYQYLRGNKITFYILILFSIIFFHVSAAILLIFPFVKFKKITFRTFVLAFFCAFVIWVLSDIVVSFFPEIFSDEAIYSHKIMVYSNQKSTFFGFLQTSIRYLIAQVGLLYFARMYASKEDIWETDYSYYMSFYIVLSVLSCGIPGFYRFMNYTIIFSLIMITEILYNIRPQLKQYSICKIAFIVIYFYSFSPFYFAYYTDINRYTYEYFIPYTSILNKNKNIDYRYEMWETAMNLEQSEKNTRDF